MAAAREDAGRKRGRGQKPHEERAGRHGGVRTAATRGGSTETSLGGATLVGSIAYPSIAIKAKDATLRSCVNHASGPPLHASLLNLSSAPKAYHMERK
jgi:hypothetical protein